MHLKVTIKSIKTLETIHHDYVREDLLSRYIKTHNSQETFGPEKSWYYETEELTLLELHQNMYEDRL